MPDDEREQRRQARRAARDSWPVRVFRLGEEPPDDLEQHTTPEQRVGMMWRLARDAWAVAGRPIPDYDRAHTPSRLVRRGARDAGDGE